MSDGEALLAVIIANPDDDTPRLIYADFLDDAGDSDRAATIRMQVQDARSTDKRAQFFTALDGGHINLDVKPAAMLGWERGFINCVTCTAEAWFKEAANIVPVNPPIELVTLTTTIPILLDHPKKTQRSDRDRGNVVIKIERPIWFGPPPHHRPADDVVCVERHTSKKEITLARDRRYLERIETDSQDALDAATSLSGYLNMKWGDKGDRKGHVKKFTLPQTMPLGEAAAICEAQRDVVGWQRAARTFLLLTESRPDVIEVDREFFDLLMQHTESRAYYLGLDMNTWGEELMLMRIPVRIRRLYATNGIPLT